MIDRLKTWLFRNSVRHFLLISLLLATVFISIIMGTWTYVQVRSNAKGVFDTSLAQAAQILRVVLANQIYQQRLAELQEALNNPYRRINPVHKTFSKHELEELKRLNSNQLVFQVWGPDNTLLLKSSQAPTIPLATVSFGSQDTEVGNLSWRTFTLPDYRQGVRFVTAIRADIASRFNATQVLQSLSPLLFFCPLLAILIWLLLDSAFRPLKRIRTLLTRRSHDNLNPIELRQAPEEIRPLLQELNSLFTRLDEAFEREKRFTADAAHELRTPLAAIRAHSQIARRNAQNPDAISALKKVAKSVDRATHVIEQLLVLSRLEPQDKLTFEDQPINITRFLQELLVDLVPMALAKNIELSLNAPQQLLELETQSGMLNILVRNLVDNAIRYTPNDGHVDINLSQHDRMIIIEVIDSGPGVPRELQQRIFDRFYRQVGNKAQGSGLGLSIVKLIVQLHRGSIRAQDRADGQSGLQVVIQLPQQQSI